MRYTLENALQDKKDGYVDYLAIVRFGDAWHVQMRNNEGMCRVISDQKGYPRKYKSLDGLFTLLEKSGFDLSWLCTSGPEDA